MLLLNLYRNKRKILPDGFLFGLSLILVFTSRFFIEFIKEHQVDYEKGMVLDMGQLLSIPYVLIGLAFVFYSIKSTKKLSQV